MVYLDPSGAPNLAVGSSHFLSAIELEEAVVERDRLAVAAPRRSPAHIFREKAMIRAFSETCDMFLVLNLKKIKIHLHEYKIIDLTRMTCVYFKITFS